MVEKLFYNCRIIITIFRIDYKLISVTMLDMYRSTFVLKLKLMTKNKSLLISVSLSDVLNLI